ncbi:MAG: hypothetical protein ACC661_09195, partial [Verrucomicrobiales bacterium]
LELLSRWFDVHLNWQKPESGAALIGRNRTSTTSSSSSTRFGQGAPYVSGTDLVAARRSSTTTTTTTITKFYERFEAPRESLDIEAGVLLPWFTRFADVRLLAGYYHLNDPFGPAIEGVRGRLEARLNDYLTFDLAWYEDAEVVGGNWFGGIRVHLPLGNTPPPISRRHSGGSGYRGRTAYNGSGASRTAGGEDVRRRLGENILRSSTIATMTTSESGFIENKSRRRTSTRRSTSRRGHSVVVVKKDFIVKKAPAIPPPSPPLTPPDEEIPQ